MSKTATVGCISSELDNHRRYNEKVTVEAMSKNAEINQYNIIENMKMIELKRRLDQEQYMLDGMSPSSKTYQAQRQKVEDLKTQIEFLSLQDNKTNTDPDNSEEA